VKQYGGSVFGVVASKSAQVGDGSSLHILGAY
jgi:hypothetical protein